MQRCWKKSERESWRITTVKIRFNPIKIYYHSFIRLWASTRRNCLVSHGPWILANVIKNCPESAKNHNPISPDCPARKLEAKVIKLKFDEGISYPEARRRVEHVMIWSCLVSDSSFFFSVATLLGTNKGLNVRQRLDQNRSRIESLKRLIDEEKRQISEIRKLEK